MYENKKINRNMDEMLENWSGTRIAGESIDEVRVL